MPGKVKHNHLNIDGAKMVAQSGDDFLRLVKLGWKTGLWLLQEARGHK